MLITNIPLKIVVTNLTRQALLFVLGFGVFAVPSRIW